MAQFITAVIVGAIWGFWPGFWTFVVLCLLADRNENPEEWTP